MRRSNEPLLKLQRLLSLFFLIALLPLPNALTGMGMKWVKATLSRSTSWDLRIFSTSCRKFGSTDFFAAASRLSMSVFLARGAANEYYEYEEDLQNSDEFTAMLRRQLEIVVTACGAVSGELFLQGTDSHNGASNEETGLPTPYLQLVCRYGPVATVAYGVDIEENTEESTVDGLIITGTELTAGVQFQNQLYGLLRLRRQPRDSWYLTHNADALRLAGLMSRSLGDIIGLEVQRMSDAAEDEAYIEELQQILDETQVSIDEATRNVRSSLQAIRTFSKQVSRRLTRDDHVGEEILSNIIVQANAINAEMVTIGSIGLDSDVELTCEDERAIMRTSTRILRATGTKQLYPQHPSALHHMALHSVESEFVDGHHNNSSDISGDPIEGDSTIETTAYDGLKAGLATNFSVGTGTSREQHQPLQIIRHSREENRCNRSTLYDMELEVISNAVESALHRSSSRNERHRTPLSIDFWSPEKEEKFVYFNITRATNNSSARTGHRSSC